MAPSNRSRPFAYNNTGLPISGTTPYDTLVVGDIETDYSSDYGGIKWWMGPDEELGYVIGNSRPGGQPVPSGVTGTAQLGFWRSKFKTNESFLDLANYIGAKNGQPPFANTTDAENWLNSQGYYSSFNVPTPSVTSTSTPTPTPSMTPTPTGVGQLINPILVGFDEYLEVGTEEYLMFVDPAGPTPTPSITPSPTETTLPPTPTTTETPTPTVTNTQTPSVTPTFTPTPSTTSTPITGFGYNLIALPYNFPASGNSIMNAASGQTGTTFINQLATTQRGFYFNSIDNIGVNRTSHYSQFTGQSVTITFTQNGDSAIYSGDSQSFKFWSGGTGDPGSPIPGTGFVFGTGIQIPPLTAGTGNVILIQSATTTWVTGATVYVSVVNNNPSVTATPTATSVTPTPTPTSGATTDGWLFYYPEGPLTVGPPSNDGNIIFVGISGLALYNPNYTGTTLNLYFNNNNNVGTSFASQFSGLDTSGGTITMSQGSNTAIYSGTSSEYTTTGNFLNLGVTRSAQMIQSASTPFVSGTTINVVVS